jgi:hypothetical protein
MNDLDKAVSLPKVGDIFRNSWGYDQTNVDYYQVVRVTAKYAIVRPISSQPVPGSDRGGMCCYVQPVSDAFTGPETRRRISVCGTRPALSATYGVCVWVAPGEKAYCSWYA